MMPYVGNFPSHYLLWIIGIIFSASFYLAFCHKFSIRFKKALIATPTIFVSEIFGAHLMFIIEAALTPGGLSNYEFLRGFSLFGVFFFSPVCFWAVSKLLKLDFRPFFDWVALGILVELGFYRIGCMLAGCCAGIVLPNGIPGSDGLLHFPSQPIEFSLDFLLFAVLLFAKVKMGPKLESGIIAGCVYLFYGLIRFVIEFTRERSNLFGPFSISHIWAVLAIVLGIVAIIFAAPRKERAGTD